MRLTVSVSIEWLVLCSLVRFGFSFSADSAPVPPSFLRAISLSTPSVHQEPPDTSAIRGILTLARWLIFILVKWTVSV
jgi:hypothetical protein